MAGRSTLTVVVLTLLSALAAIGRRQQVAPAPVVVAAPAPAADSAKAHAGAAAPVRTGLAMVSAYRAAGWIGGAGTSARVVVRHTVVVVIPDPLDSHLDWAFDSELESVRRAFESAGFVLDRYWLPWTPNANGARPAVIDDSLPGVMLFRHAAPRDSAGQSQDTLALAYFVGEIPTRGLHAAAFARALEDRRDVLSSLGDSARVTRSALRIVGPTFSGSVPALRNALDAAQARHLVGVASVITGGATAPGNAAMLRKATAAGDTIRFAATVNPVDLLRRRIEWRLRTNLAIHPNEIAYLTESGTQFGQQLRRCSELPGRGGGSCPPPARRDSIRQSAYERGDSLLETPLEIPFPMNISRLRKEYVRDVFPSDTIGRGATLRTHLDWRDPASSAESPAPLSELTAPIIEQTLADIEQTLTLHHVRAVGILATDVRDRLFLASVVRERLRDVKVFFIGSHSLYLRPELNDELRGALVVSTYPLFLENQFWDLAHPARRRLVFTSDLAEGTYNAALAQLDRPGEMLDYALPLPSGEAAGPPVWITTIGAASLLPVIADSGIWIPGSSDTLVRHLPPYVIARPTTSLRRLAEHDTGRLDAALIEIAFTLALAFALAAHFRDAERRSQRIEPPPASVAAPAADATPREQAASYWRYQQLSLAGHRRSWTWLRGVTIVCAFVPLLLVLYRAQAHGSPRARGAAGFIAAILEVTLAATIVMGWRSWQRRIPRPSLALPRPRFERRRRGWAQHVGMQALAAAYLVLTTIFYAQVTLLPADRATAFFLRATAFSSGVTPVVPLLVGALLLCTWCIWHLRRVALLGDMSAFEAACRMQAIDASDVVAGSEVGRRGANGFAGAVTGIREGLIALRPSDGERGLILALVLLAVSVGHRFNRSMETVVLGALPLGLPGSFDLLFRFLVFAAIALGTWTFYRVLIVSQAFRRFLRDVDAMPIAPAFDRLPRSLSGLTRFTPFNAPPASAVDLTIDRAVQTRWRRLIALLPPTTPDGQPRPDTLALRARPRLVLRTSHARFDDSIADPLIVLHRTLCAIAATGDAVTLDGDDAPSADAGGKDDKSRPAPKPATTWEGIAQELVALYLIDYVEWVVRHLRYLALNLVVSLALTIVLLACYPFEPESMVKVFFFALMAGSVTAIAVLLFQMSRDVTMSRITRTTPGQVTWDVQLVLNLVLVAGVPLLTLLGAQFPQVREFLFSWVTPALKAIGKS